MKRSGFIDGDLASCLAFLKAKSHSSYSALHAFMDEVFACPASRGELAKIMNKMSGALRVPYDEVLAKVASQPILNIDETGHKENGDHLWTAVATCAIKKTSLFRFLRQALNAYANNLPAPSLLTL